MRNNSSCATPAQLAAVTSNALRWIAVDSANVYFSDNGGLNECAINGCAQTPTVLSTGGNPQGIAVDSTNVYWTNYAIGPVDSCGSHGCAGTPTALTAGFGLGLTIDATTTGRAGAMSIAQDATAQRTRWGAS